MIRLHNVVTKWQSHLMPRAVALASKSSIVDAKPAESEPGPQPVEDTGGKPKRPSKLVAEVFANLSDAPVPVKVPYVGPSLTQLELKIKDAKDVESLLKIASNPNITRKMALNILSTFGNGFHWCGSRLILIFRGLDFGEKNPAI